MRVSTKALAPLSCLFSLLALASCTATASHVPVAPAYIPLPASAPGATAQRGNYDRDGGLQGTVPPHERGRYSEPKTARASLQFGGRELDEAFEPTAEPGVFGMAMNSVGANRLGVEGGFLFAYDEEQGVLGFGDLELSQTEFYLGLRAELTRGPVRPYVGIGGTWISTETRVRSGGFTATEDDSDFGMYAQGGVEFDLTESFFISIAYRQTVDLTYTVDGTDFDADYGQVTIGLGISF